MVDEQEPVKRVVKRVVKKTVVRPTSPGRPVPQVRYGRPVATAGKPQAKAAAKPSHPAAGSTPTAQTTPVVRARPVGKTAPSRPQRPAVDVKAMVRAAGHRVGDAWWAVADRSRGAAGTSGRFAAARARGVATRGRAVAAWRLPHINLYLAAVISGAVAGLVAVALGGFALQIFEGVRGVSAGGGFWGGIAFIGVGVVAALVGQALMAGFGSTSPRLTSFLAVVLTTIAMLGLFLNLIDDQPSTALIVVPALGVVTFAASHWLIDLAERSPATAE